MATIVTRAGKGSPLTHVEVDANFTNLNTAKAELASPALTGNVTVASNSATAAVTITQIGAGNALVVEDSASPDASPFVVTATGSVGIGTTTPATLLHLSSVDPVYVTMIDQGNGAGRVGQNGTALTFGVDGVNGATERMRIDNAGNVGIGTTSPSSKLHVEGTTTGGGTEPDAIAYFKQNGTWSASEPWALYVSGYSYLNGFRINAADGARSLYKTAAGGTLGFAVTGDDPITFTQLNSSERMRIAAGGNVGIGTASPTTKLDVSGTANATALSIGGTAITATAAELNFVGGVTSAIQTQLGAKAPLTGTGTSGTWPISISGNAATATNATSASTASAAFSATTLTGLTSTVAELNFVSDVTSLIQAQLNAKAPLASPALTGTPTAPTATVGTNTTQVATTAFVLANGHVPTTAEVGTATAGLAFGAVGSYAFLTSSTTTTSTSEGAVVAGSGYRYHGVGVTSSTATTAVGTPQGSAPSGTWKFMGSVTAGGTA